jgi:penicillin amidase
VTLPGTPAIVAGSNGHLAWGYTNSEGDWAIWWCWNPEDDATIRRPTDRAPSFAFRETLAVKDGPSPNAGDSGNVWGPVVDRDHRGRQRALRWVAHDPRAVNLGPLALERVGHAGSGARRSPTGPALPAQNILLASADGRISPGPSPARFRAASAMTKVACRLLGPTVSAAGPAGWNPLSIRASSIRPVAGCGPPTVGWWTGQWLALLGDGGYALGARAQQIRDGLLERDQFDEADFLALQLDDRACFSNAGATCCWRR